MNIVCMQPRFMLAAQRAKESLPDIEGEFFFLGICGSVEDVYGGYIMPFKEHVQKCRGIILYLDDIPFKAERARELPDNIKFFIDGLERRILLRNVIVVGCPINRAKTEERYILNEDRWPNPTPPEAETLSQAIHQQNSESKGDLNT